MGAKRGSKLGSEHRQKFVTAGLRARRARQKRAAKMATGADNIGGRRHTGASLDTSPAVWREATTHVGDYEFVEDGLDEVLLRAVQDRVVYGSSVTCHRSTPFEEIAIAAVAAAVRADPVRNGRGPKKGEVVELTERQRTVIALIAEGLSNEEIGERLDISPRTVKMHTDVLRGKLGASARRAIPAAYRLATGKDPFTAAAPTPVPVAIIETVGEAYEEALAEPEIEIDKHGFREGRSLGEVVSEMFGKEA